MAWGTARDGGLKRMGPLAPLLFPLLLFPLLAACSEQVEWRDDCDRPASCPERRALPILY